MYEKEKIRIYNHDNITEPKTLNVSATLPRYMCTLQFDSMDNSFAILGSVRQALHDMECTNCEITEFLDKAKTGTRDELLITCAEFMYMEDISDLVTFEYEVIPKKVDKKK